MKKSLLIVGFLLIFLCFFAHSLFASEKNFLSFKKQVVFDQQGFGIEAFRLLVPKGWKFNGGVSWDNTKYPPISNLIFRITSPDSSTVFEQFPSQFFSYSQDPNLQYSYVHSGIEVLQPVSAIDFLRTIFLIRAKSHVTNIKILETQNLPQQAQNAREIAQHEMSIFFRISPPQTQQELATDAARVKIEYVEKGQTFIEEISASLNYVTTYIPTMYGGYTKSITWGPTAVISFKTPASEMDKKIHYYNIISKSLKVNPVWQTNCISFIATLTRDHVRMTQRDIARRMQQISQTQSEISDMIYESYKQRQASQDEIMKNYSQAFRGIDSYCDPIDNFEIELPSGYENAWTNGTDIFLSEDPNFNPGSQLPRGDWKQMKRME